MEQPWSVVEYKIWNSLLQQWVEPQGHVHVFTPAISSHSLSCTSLDNFSAVHVPMRLPLLKQSYCFVFRLAWLSRYGFRVLKSIFWFWVCCFYFEGRYTMVGILHVEAFQRLRFEALKLFVCISRYLHSHHTNFKI